jgi:hypothetical protein
MTVAVGWDPQWGDLRKVLPGREKLLSRLDIIASKVIQARSSSTETPEISECSNVSLVWTV